ncbi:MAG TPA: rRNA maturation RNase YbeY [Verrucomicrobiae bacterium]|nr:rRNA maturation RNase YbeY [Verrucomicrobiae bacterium]
MIHYRNEVRNSGVNGRALKTVAQRLLGAVDEAGSSLSLTLVNDQTIREINRVHRAKDKPTDVLSFPLLDARTLRQPFGKLRVTNGRRDKVERMLGDVVISVDTALRQAVDYDASLQNELYRLLIHGVAHVMGHDHEEPAERQRMLALERRLADAIGMAWPYDAPDRRL